MTRPEQSGRVFLFDNLILLSYTVYSSAKQAERIKLPRNRSKVLLESQITNQNIPSMKQEGDVAFLEYVVKALVDNPSDVKIVRTVDEMGVLLTLSLNSADMGKIIGRMGNTAKAIRTLLRVVGMKNNARVNLKINEPEGAAPREMKTTKTVDESLEDLKI